ncbi:lytic transglycosylase [Rhodobacteraceae bacterium WD3A24]|nr:lytic transglycosylase [Rhodobacteraceae bacterium WD3A24]
MPAMTRRAMLIAVLGGLAACAGGGERERPTRRGGSGLYPNETPALRRLIERHARANDVPVSLVQRVIRRESSHRPRARNGPYYGLMQIHPQTARTMGYHGAPEGLLDPETNLRYAVRYLRGAWIVADGDPDEAVGWYARGYYYAARDRGLLEETGLR